MGLIIFLQGCEKMKINEVKELLAGTPTCEQLAELKADERSGVQKLLATYYKRLEKAAQEKERFTKMLSYEKKYYAQGIQYVAGVLPTFWMGKYMLEGHTGNLLAFAAVYLIWLVFLMKKYRKKICL